MEAKYYECSDNENFDWFKEHLKIDVGEMIYTDGNGNPVGLTVAECETGIGKINEDNDYDTTYTIYLKDANEKEIQAIRNSDQYNKDEILNVIESED